jgi:hypothetical protein
MTRPTQGRWLVGFALLITVTLGMAVVVGERVVAALWQWFKFRDTSGDGHITLSLHTGLFFVAVWSITVLLAVALGRMEGAVGPRTRLSMGLMGALGLVGAAYAALALSPLNRWVS